MQSSLPHIVCSPRRGTLLPAIAVAILTVGCCLALVLDRLWLDAARGELQTAAEAAALAAAGRLADDERINLQAEPQLLINFAREAAAEVAAGNRCAGRLVTLNPEPGGDLQFGHYTLNMDNGLSEFSETESFPTSVRCRIEQSRRLGNPVARLFGGLTGEAGGDAVGQAEATLSNLVIGVRPFNGGPVPALPLAIWEVDSTGERSDTWIAQIEGGAGSDQWTFDHLTRQVSSGADGLPEMVLRPMPAGGEPSDANFQLINVGNGLQEGYLVRQTQTGWSASDLAAFGGELRLDVGTIEVESSAALFDPTTEALLQMVGQKRIVLLYDQYFPGQGDLGRLTLTRFVAVRIMSVDISGGSPEIVVQPTVVATRTARLSEGAIARDSGWANPYVYKISLTN